MKYWTLYSLKYINDIHNSFTSITGDLHKSSVRYINHIKIKRLFHNLKQHYSIEEIWPTPWISAVLKWDDYHFACNVYKFTHTFFATIKLLHRVQNINYHCNNRRLMQQHFSKTFFRSFSSFFAFSLSYVRLTLKKYILKLFIK